jgi:hypothetical protein
MASNFLHSGYLSYTIMHVSFRQETLTYFAFLSFDCYLIFWRECWGWVGVVVFQRFYHDGVTDVTCMISGVGCDDSSTAGVDDRSKNVGCHSRPHRLSLQVSRYSFFPFHKLMNNSKHAKLQQTIIILLRCMKC